MSDQELEIPQKTPRWSQVREYLLSTLHPEKITLYLIENDILTWEEDKHVKQGGPSATRREKTRRLLCLLETKDTEQTDGRTWKCFTEALTKAGYNLDDMETYAKYTQTALASPWDCLVCPNIESLLSILEPENVKGYLVQEGLLDHDSFDHIQHGDRSATRRARAERLLDLLKPLLDAKNPRKSGKAWSDFIQGLKSAGYHQAVECLGEFNNTLRVLLVGKTGGGKSSTGNTILGSEKFETGMDCCSITSESLQHEVLLGATLVKVMDSPGLFDTTKSHEETASEVVRALCDQAPGPHAVLYVVPLCGGRFTEEEFNTYNRLKVYFGDSITDHMIVVFTYGDQLTGKNGTIDKYLSKAPESLKTVLKECGYRHIVFNNCNKSDDKQVFKLLEMIREKIQDEIQRGSQGYHTSYPREIGDKLQELIHKRVKEAEKKELENKEHVKSLQEDIQKAEQNAQIKERESRRAKLQREEAEKRCSERSKELRIAQQKTSELEEEVKLTEIARENEKQQARAQFTQNTGARQRANMTQIRMLADRIEHHKKEARTYKRNANIQLGLTPITLGISAAGFKGRRQKAAAHEEDGRKLETAREILERVDALMEEVTNPDMSFEESKKKLEEVDELEREFQSVMEQVTALDKLS